MLKTGLEFAAGTTNDCKELVQRLFEPQEILGAYRDARRHFNTGDLVLVASESDPSGFEATPRIQYIKNLRAILGHLAPRALAAAAITERSAHGIVQLPFENDAMWLVVIRHQQLPIMVVIYASPYQQVATAN